MPDEETKTTHATLDQVLEAVGGLSTKVDTLTKAVGKATETANAASATAAQAYSAATTAQGDVQETKGLSESVLGELANVSGTLKKQNEVADAHATEVLKLSGSVSSAVDKMAKVTLAADTATASAATTIGIQRESAETAAKVVKAGEKASEDTAAMISEVARARAGERSAANMRHAVTGLFIVISTVLSQRYLAHNDVTPPALAAAAAAPQVIYVAAPPTTTPPSSSSAR